MTATDKPFKVYVGTYAKYSSGSLKGAHLDLEAYMDLEEFYDACRKLHEDEVDPEFMFQDFPEIGGLISESDIDEKVWDIIDMYPDQREIVLVYGRDQSLVDEDLEDIASKFCGVHDADEDFAEHYFWKFHEEGMRAALEMGLSIDWKRTWGSNLTYTFMSIRHGGENWYFLNN